MSVSVEDVRTVLEDDLGFRWERLAYSQNSPIAALVIDGEKYEFEIVDVKTGSEGDWQTEVYVVFRVGDQHFRKTGYYASHDGEYWDGTLSEVVGKPETYIVWRDK